MGSRFIRLVEMEMAEGKCLVISAINNQKVSLGQKVTFENDGKVQEVFLKNAVVLDEQGIDKLVSGLKKAKESLKKIREAVQ